MAESKRSIVVTLKAVIDQYKRGMKDAADATANVSKETKAAEAAAAQAAKTHAKAAGEMSTSMRDAGRSLTATGAGIIGVLGLTAKAAIDWESAWTGVTKTVNGTEQELSGLEGQLRQMARTIPASQSEIAAVAEAAGQLGVKTKDIASFTRVMIDLGNTTNLTADEAATSLAQLMNVMGTAGDDVGRLGATVVLLGNNGASTERDIVQMAQRIAGAGKQVGLSEAQVLAYASALSSVGIEAEAGGSAISQSFLRIDQAVRAGGAGLALLADTSGMTAAQFKKAYEQDAAGAVATFLKGLGRAGAKGADVTAILKDLGVEGIREADALRRLAASGDLLSSSLGDADQAWKANTALAQEALKRYDTAASKIEVSWNRIKDAAITAGGAVAPVVTSIIDRIGVLADAVGKLPPSLTTGMMSAAGVVGAGALLGGGLLQAGASMLEFRKTWSALSDFSGGTKLQGAIKGLGVATGVTAVAFGLLQAAQDAWERSAEKQVTTASDLMSAMSLAGSSASMLAGATQDAFKIDTGASTVRGVKDAFDQLDWYSKSWWDKFWTRAPGGTDDAQKQMNADINGELIKKQFAQYDKALASLTSAGSAGTAIKQFNAIVSESGRTAAEVAALFPDYRAQLENTADSLGVKTKLSAQDYVDWMGGRVPDAVATAAKAQGKIVGALDTTVASLKDVVDGLFAASRGFAGLYDAETGYYQAVADAKSSLKENGRTLDVNTEAGLRNRDALSQMASQARAYTEQMAANKVSTPELVALVQKQRDAFIAQAIAMDGTSKNADEARKKAEALADKMGLIPSVVSMRYNTPGADAARGNIDAILAAIAKLPPEKQTAIKALVAQGDLAAAQAALDALTKPRAVTIKISPVTGDIVTSVGYRATAQADGSLLRFYGSGGVENHVAQMAPAGAWRIWAEPETGGEAYIPLSPAKRGRSLDIWRQTGRALGVQGFADGGLIGGKSSINVGAPNVGVAVYLDGNILDARTKVMIGNTQASLSRAQKRAEL